MSGRTWNDFFKQMLASPGPLLDSNASYATDGDSVRTLVRLSDLYILLPIAW